MITRVQLLLRPEGKGLLREEWAYYLYSALLENVSHEFGDVLHKDAITPVSHFLSKDRGKIYWTVNLLGEKSETILTPVLMEKASYYLQQERLNLCVEDLELEKIKNVETLFACAEACAGKHQLNFITPTAFKSRGQYINLPTTRLMIQNLVKKWNGCFPDVAIEDEDGKGIDVLAEGIRCKSYNLHSTNYRLKGSLVPGFTGNMILENKLADFPRKLADTLLLFSEYSGIGIKTALGMGGIKIKNCLTD